jgi:hypothetical protein
MSRSAHTLDHTPDRSPECSLGLVSSLVASPGLGRALSGAIRRTLRAGRVGTALDDGVRTKSDAESARSVLGVDLSPQPEDSPVSRRRAHRRSRSFFDASVKDFRPIEVER